jgi:tRNA 2-thiouridine synthesizing protein A
VTKAAPKINPDRKLDCIGLFCPEPVIKTRRELDRMKINETLEVLADDPAAESDIRSLAKELKHEILGVTKNGDVTHVFIKKKGKRNQGGTIV